METLPLYVGATFSITTLLAIWIFSRAAHCSKPLLFLLLALIVIQSSLGLWGFYSNVNLVTARFPLLVFPLMVFFISLFITRGGKAFIDSLDIKTLTLLHAIRIPVEIVLLWLFLHHTIPQAMTFEGSNFDILSGLSAPLVYYFGFIKKQLNRMVMIIWNIVCILLLLNVVSNAVLSLPGRFQNFGFEQSNIAVGYFPFLLLPAILVPMVLFANAASIRQLILKKNISLTNL